jgi:GT2 family glycosyltransferase
MEREMTSTNAIDIIIVNYRSIEDTLKAVSAITPWPHGRIILVDNSEDSVEAAYLADALTDISNVQLLVPEKNLGFGGGCNLAFEQSTADFVLLLNPDARIDEPNILMLMETMRINPHFGGVSPKTFWDDAHHFLLPAAFPQTPLILLATTLASHMPRLTQWWAYHYLRKMRGSMASAEPYSIPFLVGAVMMLRRSAVVAAGGLFDPTYFMFYEDSDLSIRLRKAGYKLGIVPTAEAIHEYRHKSYKSGMMETSRLQYFRKNFPLFFKITNQLALIYRCSPHINLKQWGNVIEKPIDSYQAFLAEIGLLGIVAFSPSIIMMPAIFRPLDALPILFNELDWERIEPGRYMLICCDKRNSRLRWISFERGEARNK